MKKLSSFRLSENTKNKLQNLSDNYKISQAELIELMCNFVEKTDKNKFNFEVSVRAYKLEKTPAFKKFKSEYDKLDDNGKNLMLKKFADDGFKLQDKNK